MWRREGIWCVRLRVRQIGRIPDCTAQPPEGRGTRDVPSASPGRTSSIAMLVESRARFALYSATQSLWWPRRPLATLGRKPRQGRKAATVSIDAGAEVSRRGHRLFRASHEKPCFASQTMGPGPVLPIPVRSGRPLPRGIPTVDIRDTSVLAAFLLSANARRIKSRRGHSADLRSLQNTGCYGPGCSQSSPPSA